MYAIIENGGRQYRVSANDIIEVNQLDAVPGIAMTFDKVLLVSDGQSVSVGRPYVTTARVQAQVLAHKKGEKVTIYKFRRRKDADKKTGHRQRLTRLLITAIES